MANQIKDNSVKLIITDPPYGKEDLWQFEDLGKKSFEKLPDDGSLATLAGNWALPQVIRYLEDAGLTYRWTFCVKHAGHMARIWNLSISVHWKPMLWFTKSNEKPTVHLGTIHDIAPSSSDSEEDDFSDPIISKQNDKALHPWQQSDTEVEHFIKHLTVKGDTVWDPFAGSGTFLVEALKLGRIPIGAEIDKDHYDVARGNLAKVFKEIEMGTIFTPDRRSEELSKLREKKGA